jgi:hypothetical protein
MRGVTLLALVLSTGCSKQRTIDRAELRSDLDAGISMSSEASLFLQSVAEDRTFQSFSQGHLRYLAEEANRTKKELHQSVASAQDAPTLKQACLQFDALSQELRAIGQKSSDPSALISSKRRLTEIGNAMEKAKSSI